MIDFNFLKNLNIRNISFVKSLNIIISKKQARVDVSVYSVDKAAKSIDTFGLFLMHQFGKRPKGERHFNDREMSLEEKNSVKRLLDLGIITFESQTKDYGFDCAYHWTEFGDRVMQYLRVV